MTRHIITELWKFDTIQGRVNSFVCPSSKLSSGYSAKQWKNWVMFGDVLFSVFTERYFTMEALRHGGTTVAGFCLSK